MSGGADAVVDIRGVRFAWRREAPPLLNIESLQVARGERLFLRGPSGSGKSTLLNLIAGVIVPQHGTITILGRDSSALGGAARDQMRADHIGYIFQLFNLIPYLSVVENVSLPCRFSQRRRDRAAASSGGVEADATRLLDALDLGGRDLLRRNVTTLSVGQQQRVAAARALIGSPEVVIADEPTSSLDADRRAAFLDLLFAQCIRERTALIFASHDASLAASFDRSIDLAHR